MGLRIVKLGYSGKPWRLVDEKDREIWVPAIFDHPDLRKMRVEDPFAADTKGELVQMVIDRLDAAGQEILRLRDKLSCINPCKERTACRGRGHCTCTVFEDGHTRNLYGAVVATRRGLIGAPERPI